MPKPKYLPPPPIEVTLCQDCGYFGEPYRVSKCQDKKRYIFKCKLHGIEIGYSSATCEDATNKKRFGKEHVEPLRSETGWEDY